MTDAKHYAVLTETTEFPTFLYHQDFPDGKLFKTAADWPEGPGWVDTPQKFDDAYVAPPSVLDGTLPREAALSGYVPEAYPKHVYRKGNADEPLAIRSKEHEDELIAKGIYDPALMRCSPDPKDACWSDAPAPGVAPVHDAPPVTAATLTPAEVAARKTELYATTVDNVAKRLADITDVAVLDLVAEYEHGNPKGARQGVLKAVAKRKIDLTPVV